MNIETLTSFFMWCSIINVGLLLLWTAFIVFAPDLVYRKQIKFFQIPREAFDVAIYALIGTFKLGVIMFNIVPYVALSIVGSS